MNHINDESEDRHRHSSDWYKLEATKTKLRQVKAKGSDYASMVINAELQKGGLGAQKVRDILKSHIRDSMQFLESIKDVSLSDPRIICMFLDKYLDASMECKNAEMKQKYIGDFMTQVARFATLIDFATMMGEFLRILANPNLTLGQQIPEVVRSWTELAKDPDRKPKHTIFFRPQQLCIYFNTGECNAGVAGCKFVHACLSCHQFGHGLKGCTDSPQSSAVHKFVKELNRNNGSFSNNNNNNNNRYPGNKSYPRRGRRRQPNYSQGHGVGNYPQPNYYPNHSWSQQPFFAGNSQYQPASATQNTGIYSIPPVPGAQPQMKGSGNAGGAKRGGKK